MKKTIAGVICLSLCLLTASCASSSTTVPSAETKENTTLTAEQTEATAEQTAAETASTQIAEPTTETTVSQTQQTNASDGIRFSDLPTEFVFSSGAGGWATTLTLRADGTFDGIYSDSDYMELYYSTFDGKLGQPRKTGEHTYLVKIEEFHVTNDQDKVFYEEGVEYIPSDPYGLENTNELTLYTPGTPLSEMPEECRSWLMFYEDSVLADGDYVLYNAQEGDAFFGSR